MAVNQPRRFRLNASAVFWLLIGVAVALPVCTVVSSLIYPLPREFQPAETIVVPLAAEQAIYTEQKYSGSIWLRFSGTGHVSEDLITDAFCLYDSMGAVHMEDWRLAYGIAVDDDPRLFLAGGAVASVQGSLTRCQADDHVYYLIYNLGEEPRGMSFRSVDQSIEDNSGEFVVDISYERFPEIPPPER